jgi:diadenosine tetraphosphatase ApaH/serine/threonine PP2A family protein phosphatase
VLADAEGAYDEILCCGDLIGYGADPNTVIEWSRAHVKAIVRGNHDRASVGMEDLEWFNPVARSAALWTQRELTPENCEYVRRLPRGPLAVGGFQVVHGSPLDEDAYMVGASDALQALTYVDSRLSFFGHTHLQGGFAFRDSTLQILSRPDARETELTLRIQPESVYLINPGSVGQPRDGDARAAYAIHDAKANAVLYRRVRYDVQKAQAKIRGANLPPVLAERLAMGR